MPNDEQEEMMKYAEKIYTQTFQSVCQERGYNHVQEKEACDRAIGTANQLHTFAEAANEQRTELAKEADVAIQEEQEKTGS